MGVYDIFIDGEENEQVKCFNSFMRVFKPGDVVPIKELGKKLKSFTIATPSYGGEEIPASKEFMASGLMASAYPRCFIIIVDGVFKKITRDPSEIVFPVIGKYGEVVKETGK